jgi:hypothetical protein
VAANVERESDAQVQTGHLSASVCRLRAELPEIRNRFPSDSRSFGDNFRSFGDRFLTPRSRLDSADGEAFENFGMIV